MSSSGFQKRGFGPHGSRYGGPSSGNNNNNNNSRDDESRNRSRSSSRSYSRSYDSPRNDRRNDRQSSERVWANPPFFQYNPQVWANNNNNSNDNSRNNNPRYRGNSQQFRTNYQGRGNARSSYSRSGGFRFSNGRGSGPFNWRYPQNDSNKQEEPSPPLLGSEEERRQKITDAVDELKRKLLCNDGATTEDVNFSDEDSNPGENENKEVVKGIPELKHGPPELNLTPNDLKDIGRVHTESAKATECDNDNDNDLCEIIEHQTVKVFSEITINDSHESIDSEINSNSLVSDCDKDEKKTRSDKASNSSKSNPSNSSKSKSKKLEDEKINESNREKSVKEKEKSSRSDEKYRRRDKDQSRSSSSSSHKKRGESQSSRKSSINPDSFDICKKDEKEERSEGARADKKTKAVPVWSIGASPDVSASSRSVSPFLKTTSSQISPNFPRESGKKRFSRGSSQSFTPPLISNVGEVLQPPPAFDPRPRSDEVPLPQLLHESWMYNQMPPIQMMPPMNLPPLDYGYVPPMAPFGQMTYPQVLDYGPPPSMVHHHLDRPPSPFTNPLDTTQPSENEALNELRKAMEFAEEIMGMTGNQDKNAADDYLDNFPTLPDLPPIPADLQLPVALPPSEKPEKSPKTSKKGSKKREKTEKTAAKMIGPQLKVEIDAMDIPIPGEPSKTPPQSPQEEARRKVAFNVTPKFKKIDTSNWTNSTNPVKSSAPSKPDIPFLSEKTDVSENPSTSQAPKIPQKQDSPMDIMDFMKSVKFDNFQTSPSIPEKSYTPDPVESPSLPPNPQKPPAASSSSWKDRVIGRFLKMSKNDIQNMINHSNLRKFDIAMQHLVKEKKSSLSLEMRNTEDEKIKSSNNSYDKDDFIHQLKAILDPAATVDISDLPTNFIHQLSQVLQLDVVTTDKEPSSQPQTYKFPAETTPPEIDHVQQRQLNESSQNVENDAPAITSDMPKSRKIDSRASKDTTKNTCTVVDKTIKNTRSRIKRSKFEEISDNPAAEIANLSPKLVEKSDNKDNKDNNKDTLIMDELDDIFTAGMRTKNLTNPQFSTFLNTRYHIPNYDVHNQETSVKRMETQTPINERVDSIFNAGIAIAKAKGPSSLIKSPIRTEDQTRVMLRGRKTSSDFDVFRNLTKEEYDAKYGESSHSSYDNPYRIMNPKHLRKHGDHVNGENCAVDESFNKQDQMTKSRFSRSPSRLSHNTQQSESGGDNDDDEGDNSDYDSETSSTGSSSNDSSDEPSIDVSKMLRFIKEREKIAKKKSINEEIRDEVTAEIERKRREKKAHREHKAKLKKKDKKKREKKGKKRKNRKKKKEKRRSHHSDDGHHEERPHVLSEVEIKKEEKDQEKAEIKEEIVSPPLIRKKIIGPKSVMAKAALLEKEEQMMRAAKLIQANSLINAVKEAPIQLMTTASQSPSRSPEKSPKSPANSQNNQFLKTKAQLKQMPDAVKKNADKFGASPIVQVSQPISEGSVQNKYVDSFKSRNERIGPVTPPLTAEKASEFLKKSAERVETLMQPRQFKSVSESKKNHEKMDVIGNSGHLSARQGLASPFHISNLIKNAVSGPQESSSQSRSPPEEEMKEIRKSCPKKLDLKSYKERALLHRLRAEGKLPQQETPEIPQISGIAVKNFDVSFRENDELKKVPITKELAPVVSLRDFRILSKSEINASSFNFEGKLSVIDKKSPQIAEECAKNDKFDKFERNNVEKNVKNFEEEKERDEIIEKKLTIDLPKASKPGPKSIKRRRSSADGPERGIEASSSPIPAKIILHPEKLGKKAENIIEKELLNNKSESQKYSKWNYLFRFEKSTKSDGLPDTVPVETLPAPKNRELIPENIEMDICDENLPLKIEESDHNEELPKLDPEMVKKSLLNAEKNLLDPEEAALIPEDPEKSISLKLPQELQNSPQIKETCEDISDQSLDKPNISIIPRADDLLNLENLEKSDSPTIASGPQLPEDLGPSEASEALLVDAKSPDQPESSESFLPITLKSSESLEKDSNLEETFSHHLPTSQEVSKLSPDNRDIYSPSEKLQEAIIDKETDDLASFREDEAKWRAESDRLSAEIHNESDQKDEDQVSFPESHSTNWQLDPERKNVVLHDRALVVDTPRNSLLDDPIAFATSNNSPSNEATDEYGMLCENDDIPGSIYENQLAENSPIDIDDVPIRGSFTPDNEGPGEIIEENNLENHVTIADKDLMGVGKNMSPDRLPSPILQDPGTSILDDCEEGPKEEKGGEELRKIDEEVDRNMKREESLTDEIEEKAEEVDDHPPELEEVHEKIEEIPVGCQFDKGEEEGALADEREMPRLTVADVSNVSDVADVEKEEKDQKSCVLDDPSIKKEAEQHEEPLEVPQPEEKRGEEQKDKQEEKEVPDKIVSKDRHSKKHKTPDPLKKLNKSSIPKEHKKQKHHHDKKKSKITEARVEEAIKSNIVTEIEKPTTKNAVMERMREIDIAIQNLMNEKMTLYQMLQTDEWPSIITETSSVTEEVIEQKTKSKVDKDKTTPSHQEKKKPENKVKETIEPVPAKSSTPDAPARDSKSSKTSKIEEKRPPSWEEKVPHKSAKKRAHSKEPDSTKSKEPRKEEPEPPKNSSESNRKEKKTSKNPEDSKKPVKLSQLIAREFKPKPSSNLRKKSISPNGEDKKEKENSRQKSVEKSVNSRIKAVNDTDPDKIEASDSANSRPEDKKRKKTSGNQDDNHQPLLYSDDSTLDSVDRSANDQKRATGLALLEESMKREAIAKRMKDSSKRSKESTPDDEDIDMSKLNLKKKQGSKKSSKKSVEVSGGTKTKKHVQEVIDAVAKNRINELYKGDGSKKGEKPGKLAEGGRRRSLAEEIDDLFAAEPKIQVKSQKKLEKVQNLKNDSDDDAEDRKTKNSGSLETSAAGNDKNEDVKPSKRQVLQISDFEKEKKIKKERNEDGRSSSSVRNEILQDWSDSSSNSSLESKFKHRKTSNASAAVIEDSENEEKKQKPKSQDLKSSKSSVSSLKPEKLVEKSKTKEFDRKSRESEKSRSKPEKPRSSKDQERSRSLKNRDDDSPIEGDDEDEEASFKKRGRSKKSKKMSSRRSNKSSSRSRSRSKRIIRSSSRDSSPEIEKPKKRPRSGSSTSSIASRRKSSAQSEASKPRKTHQTSKFTRTREEMMNCRVDLIDCSYLLNLTPSEILQSKILKKHGVTRINSWTPPKCVLLSDEKSRSEDDSMIVIEADENIGSSSVIELIESGLDMEDNISEKSACLGFPTSPRIEELAKSGLSDVQLIDDDKEDVEDPEVIDIKDEPLLMDIEPPKSSKIDDHMDSKSKDTKDTAKTTDGGHAQGQGQGQGHEDLHPHHDLDLEHDADDRHDLEDNEPDRMRYTVHKGPILDIKVFRDSFLAASEDGAIYRYSQKSNGILNIYQGHEAAVTCLYVHEIPGISAVESRKWFLFSGSLDASLRCYDVIGGSLNRPVVPIGSPIQCMDQAWGSIFIGTKSGHISRYDIKSASLREEKLDFSDKPVLALRASTEGPRKVLIVASRNQPITIRDAQNGLFLRTISGQRTHTVYSLLKDRDLVYCGTSSTSIPVFDFLNGEQVQQYTAGVGIVCMRLYRQLLFAGCYDGNIYVFDTKEPKLICSIPGPGNMLLSMEIVEHTIIAGSKDRRLHAWAMPPQVRAILHDRT